MCIIRTHDITLYGGTNSKIILHPLSDEHLPYLYKWCADPEVLYWTEGGTDNPNLTYGKDTVHDIYGGVSQNAFCFLIEVDGVSIGECWLQKMNLPNVIAMYKPSVDVRRIDMSIGEKKYWNRGIGTRFIGMMIDFAFNNEHVDVLHCFSVDYNIRSCRMWEKHGFSLFLSESLQQPQKGEYQYHYRLTRQAYMEKRRHHPVESNIYQLQITDLQPSQLYISEGKLRNVLEWFDPKSKSNFDPIPIKCFQTRNLMTDGHTRTVAAYLAGWYEVPVYLDTDNLDMDASAIDVKWCDEMGVNNPANLANRIVSHKDFERLWRRRCMNMAL